MNAPDEEHFECLTNLQQVLHADWCLGRIIAWCFPGAGVCRFWVTVGPAVLWIVTAHQPMFFLLSERNIHLFVKPTEFQTISGLFHRPSV